MCNKLFLPHPPSLKNAPAIGVTEHFPRPKFAFLDALQSSKVDNCHWNLCPGNKYSAGTGERGGSNLLR